MLQNFYINKMRQQNTNNLVGKKFKYNSKYGLSDWTHTIDEVIIFTHVDTTPKGFSVGDKTILVNSKESGQSYDLNEIIFID